MPRCRTSTSTSRCRHLEVRAHANCLDFKTHKQWVVGQLFSRSRIAEFTVQSSVSSQNSWHLKQGLNLYAFKFCFSKCSNFVHLKVRYTSSFTVQSSVSSQNSWHLKQGLNLYAFKFCFSKCSNFVHLKVRYTSSFTVQSSVSSQNSWHLKHGLNLYAFKLHFSKCSNFAHLKVLGTRRLRFLGGSLVRMRDQFWPSFHWSNLLLRLYFDNCLTLIQACVLIDLQLILHWVG